MFAPHELLYILLLKLSRDVWLEHVSLKKVNGCQDKTNFSSVIVLNLSGRLAATGDAIFFCDKAHWFGAYHAWHKFATKTQFCLLAQFPQIVS